MPATHLLLTDQWRRGAIADSREKKAGSNRAMRSTKASPMSLAIEWVARITAVALLMVLPGVGGQWLDSRFSTNFLTLVGFGFGFVAGFVALLAMVKIKKASGLSSEVTPVSTERHEQADGETGER